MGRGVQPHEWPGGFIRFGECAVANLRFQRAAQDCDPGHRARTMCRLGQRPTGDPRFNHEPPGLTAATKAAPGNKCGSTPSKPLLKTKVRACSTCLLVAIIVEQALSADAQMQPRHLRTRADGDILGVPHGFGRQHEMNAAIDDDAPAHGAAGQDLDGTVIRGPIQTRRQSNGHRYGSDHDQSGRDDRSRPVDNGQTDAVSFTIHNLQSRHALRPR